MCVWLRVWLPSHTHVLQRLVELGADVVHAYDSDGRSPLDLAVYYCHKNASEYLRGLQHGEPTRREQVVRDLAATKLQAHRRGSKARSEMAALLMLSPTHKARRATLLVEEQAAGMHM